MQRIEDQTHGAPELHEWSRNLPSLFGRTRRAVKPPEAPLMNPRPRDEVRVSRHDRITVVTIDRPDQRNAIAPRTAGALKRAFSDFERDEESDIAVLYGAGGNFCAGADLKAIASGDLHHVSEDGDGPLGVTRMQLTKPVIAAVEGYAVAGGLELALWCDLRVCSDDAIFGVFCRRFGVPLIDGGTRRLPALVGLGRAMDLILTGRPVDASEALQIGLAQRVVPGGSALKAALELAAEIARFPQGCLRADRANVYDNLHRELDDALRNEVRRSASIIAAESVVGAEAFSAGAGRGGRERS